MSDGDPELTGLSPLTGVPLGFWCGEQDGFADDLRALVARLPHPPERAVFADGGHTRVFWNHHSLDAFAWLASRL